MIKNFTVHRYDNMEIEYCRYSDVLCLIKNYIIYFQNKEWYLEN